MARQANVDAPHDLARFSLLNRLSLVQSGKMELNWFIKFNLSKSSDFVDSLAPPPSTPPSIVFYIFHVTRAARIDYMKDGCEIWVWTLQFNTHDTLCCEWGWRRRRRRCHKKDKTSNNWKYPECSFHVEKCFFVLLFFPPLFLYLYCITFMLLYSWVCLCVYKCVCKHQPQRQRFEILDFQPYNAWVGWYEQLHFTSEFYEECSCLIRPCGYGCEKDPVECSSVHIILKQINRCVFNKWCF